MSRELGRDMLKKMTSGEEGSRGDLGAARQERDGQRGPSATAFIPHKVFIKPFLQKSIPVQIRQLILYYDRYEE